VRFEGYEFPWSRGLLAGILQASGFPENLLDQLASR